jgi:hypothetical protein
LRFDLSEKAKSSKSLFFAAQFLPFFAKKLFDASPYLPTTSDQKLRFSKNITGFEPRDLIDLDSSGAK